MVQFGLIQFSLSGLTQFNPIQFSQIQLTSFRSDSTHSNSIHFNVTPFSRININSVHSNLIQSEKKYLSSLGSCDTQLYFFRRVQKCSMIYGQMKRIIDHCDVNIRCSSVYAVSASTVVDDALPCSQETVCSLITTVISALPTPSFSLNSVFGVSNCVPCFLNLRNKTTRQGKARHCALFTCCHRN